jgi:hypothetical protein
MGAFGRLRYVQRCGRRLGVVDRRLRILRYAIAAAGAGVILSVGQQRFPGRDAYRTAGPINGVADAIGKIHRCGEIRACSVHQSAAKHVIVPLRHAVAVERVYQFGGVIRPSADYRVSVYRSRVGRRQESSRTNRIVPPAGWDVTGPARPCRNQRKLSIPGCGDQAYRGQRPQNAALAFPAAVSICNQQYVLLPALSHRSLSGRQNSTSKRRCYGNGKVV